MGRLALTWFNQDKAVLPDADGGYEWVECDDPRVTEVRLLEEVARVGEVSGTPDDNLLIHGDSYDALLALVRTPEYAERYRGKVKLVYIDPPFNTGQAFEHYEDNFDHSIWLTLFRDRVRLLHDLLTEDGSIWVHLDHTEVHRARSVLDDEFGSSSFVAEIVWQKTYTRENRTDISTSHDVILVYAINRAGWKHVRNKLPSSAAQIARYINPDNDPRGPWKPTPLHAKAEAGRRAAQFFTVTTPSGRSVDPPPGRCWLVTRDRYEELLADQRISFGARGDGVPTLKKFLNEVAVGLVPTTLWFYDEVGGTGTAKDEIKDLFPKASVPFSTPKPERLLQRVLQIGSNPGDIVVDCFGGSGTTAAVAHKMGRRWVTVEAQANTIQTFTKPRLEKVVDGSDEGGITFVDERVTELELPDDVTVRELDDARKTLAKLVEAGALDADETVLAELLKQLRTKRSSQRMWHGGGGFRFLRVEEPQVVVAGNRAVLRDAALGRLPEYVAAQLGYTAATDRRGVVGLKGRDVLVVVAGVVDEQQVAFGVSLLNEHETLTMAGLAIHPLARTAMTAAPAGSRVLKVPDDLVSRSKVLR